ncbi:hypothetical protein M8C21_023363 [Ambrosia artemisiifolia]|uniref:Uncharacterized protein n=1 Tax=Ambrosia artemisiifolia TaxID=4212 RepID=A0AAD5CRK3_AMBAR|nr:hypothetical protein M8C21_023363 [Ambrosia artemisiifolia]
MVRQASRKIALTQQTITRMSCLRLTTDYAQKRRICNHWLSGSGFMTLLSMHGRMCLPTTQATDLPEYRDAYFSLPPQW